MEVLTEEEGVLEAGLGGAIATDPGGQLPPVKAVRKHSRWHHRQDNRKPGRKP